MQFEKIIIPDNKGLRDFGLITAGLLVGLFGLGFPWLFGTMFPRWPWIIAGILSLLALCIPASLKQVYVGWMYIGMVLGWINTRLILLIMFYLIILPMGLLIRLVGKNPMNPKVETTDSYRHSSHHRSSKHMEHPF